MTKQFIQFLTRWLANYAGLMACVLFGIISVEGSWVHVLICAVLLTVANAIVKPFLIIFTLPLIAFTLGFFLIVINAVIIYVLSLLYGPIEIVNFWHAIVAGIVIGLLNYIVTIMYERLSRQ
jgi:putative membrane protein